MTASLRRLAATAGIAALLLATAGAVHADIGDPVNCVRDPTNPACVVQVKDPGGAVGGSGGSATCRNYWGEPVPCYIPGKGWYGGDGCWYRRAAGVDLRFAETLSGKAEPPAFWYVGSCGDPLTNFWPSSLVRYRVFGTDPGVRLLAQQAVRQLNLPRPRIRLNPDSAPTVATALPVPQVVNFATWLWIDPLGWTTRSATASLAGLSVTAVGTPIRVTWSTGDGHTDTCGPGTPWRPGMDPTATSPDCGHIYTQPGRYPLTATITWEVTWAGGGVSGTEPTLTSTASVAIQVIEAAAVNTRASGPGR